MSSVFNPAFAINQLVYAITATGVLSGTVLAITALLTQTAPTTPLITYAVRLTGNTSTTNIAEGELFATLGDEASTVGSLVPGTAYSVGGTYTNVALTGGHGIGIAATVVVASGVVNTVAITSGGTGYVTGDVLTIPALGGVGSGATVTVTAVSQGAITAYQATIV